MTVTIHQPNHLPYLGFFYKIITANLFIILDDCDYEKENYQNRNRIRTSHGYQWLVVPVNSSINMKINKVDIDKRCNGLKKWLRTIEHHYHRAKYFYDYFGFFASLQNSFTKIEQLNSHIITYLIKELVGDVKIVKSSQFNIDTLSTKRVVDLCNAVKADVFISGHGAKAYLNSEMFIDSNIELKFSDFIHPVYRQVYEPFLTNMSAIDLLFNYGSDAKNILKNSNKEQIID